MNRLFTRRTIIGFIVGILAAGISAGITVLVFGADALLTTPGMLALPVAVVIYTVIAIAAALLYIHLFEPTSIGNIVQNTLSGIAYGTFLWILFSLNILPPLFGERPLWRAEAVVSALGSFPGFLLMGGMIGLSSRQAITLVDRLFGEIDATPKLEETPTKARIIIIGGGFAGVEAAKQLEQRFPVDSGVEITLISDTNHLLFTPMLTEVVSGEVDAQHIAPTLRTYFERVRVILGRPTSIDTTAQQVHMDSDYSAEKILDYDHLVLTVGNVTNYFGNDAIEENAFSFQTLSDAFALRNHVIRMMERADRTSDRDVRRAALRFVIVGAGYSGTAPHDPINAGWRGIYGGLAGLLTGVFFSLILSIALAMQLQAADDRIPDIPDIRQQKCECFNAP